MEIHTDYVDPTASALSYENVSFNKTEDSGYHTFTPGSLECAEISTDYVDQSVITSKAITGQIQIGYFHVTPEVNIQLGHHYTHSMAINESQSETPPFRRGYKRPHSSTVEKSDSFTNSIPTPTSFIAGKIKNLDVNENKENSEIFSPVSSQCSDKYKKCLYVHDFEQILSYPTTPVKKNCRRSPCRKSGKQPNFVIHSLSCETNGLQNKNLRVPSKAVRTINFWPDQKVDIIQKLYIEAVAIPPVMQILSYLSNEDIRNFCSVSEVWNNIWKSVSDNNKKKKDYECFLKNVKENQENRDKGVTPKITKLKPARHLREILTDLNDNNTMKVNNARSPPASPRTNRFRKFTKSASLDSRCQLSCIRCRQPAKVTEETSGEVWVECVSSLCLYQFCKFCKCNRHPGKFCFQYDLNGPSPSKRKKSQYAIGTKKSRRNLLRL